MARTTTRKKSKAAGTTRKKSVKKSAARKTSKKKSAGGKKTTRKKVSTAQSKKKTRTKTKTKTKAKTAAKSAGPKIKSKSGKKTTRGMISKQPTPKTESASPKVKKSTTSKTPKAKTGGGKSRKSVATGAKGKRPRSVVEVASSTTADEKGYVFINGRRVRMISTQGVTPSKKPRPVAVEEEAPEDAGPPRPLKSPLSKKELNHYRELLLIKRAEIFGDLTAMEAAALRSSGGEVSHMPIHMADIGTDTYDQDFTLGLAEAERRQLREIDEALQRIEDGTYGVCHMTGNDIPKARLDAKPWAKYTIEAARLVESQMQR